jgi:hypothetical protein
MTYNMPTDTIRTQIETVAATCEGRYLSGDGFDKNDAPKLDAYLTALGFTVAGVGVQGSGQLHSATTVCGISVYRNGYCMTLKGGNA